VTGRLRAFAAFWYDFVVGDDWLLALAVVAGLGAVYGLAQAGLAAWWLLPVVAAVALAVSLWRAVRRARPGESR
jgi:membrane protein implicated in regulation of membrane protease activity